MRKRNIARNPTILKCNGFFSNSLREAVTPSDSRGACKIVFKKDAPVYDNQPTPSLVPAYLPDVRVKSQSSEQAG